MRRKMKVEIISRETIKPLFPTPNHLQTIKLSFLDQIAPATYVPLTFFYINDLYHFGDIINNAKVIERCYRLKKSLSQILISFYPLAGRMKTDGMSIDCNDAGAHYTEARVHARLSDVLQYQAKDVLDLMLPCARGEKAGSVLLLIQVNVFDCGGMAIVLTISHKIIDVFSYTMFISSWASATRGIVESNKIVQPLFNAASYFPCNAEDSIMSRSMPKVSRTKSVTKKFVFDASKIASLRAHYKSSWGGRGIYSTRVEALSAFIWENFIKAARANRGQDGSATYAASHVVNLRGKIGIPYNTFGNVFSAVVSVPLTMVEIDKKDVDFVGRIRQAIKAIDDESVKKLQCGDWRPPFIMPVVNSDDHPVEVLRFTSWCKQPFYQDFGWGKPTRIDDASEHLQNLVVLMDTEYNDGIQALVTISEEDMDEFERHLRPSSRL